jgi:hypothetical protein
MRDQQSFDWQLVNLIFTYILIYVPWIQELEWQSDVDKSYKYKTYRQVNIPNIIKISPDIYF